MRASIEALLSQDTKTKFSFEVTLEQLLKLGSSAGVTTTVPTATTRNSGSESSLSQRAEMGMNWVVIDF